MARIKIYMDPTSKKLNPVNTSYGEIIPKKITIGKDTIKLEEIGRTLPKGKINFIDIKTNKSISYTKIKNGEYDFYQISTRKKYMVVAVCLFFILTPLAIRFLKRIPESTLSNLALVIFVLVMIYLSKHETTRAQKIALEISKNL